MKLALPCKLLVERCEWCKRCEGMKVWHDCGVIVLWLGSICSVLVLYVV